MSYDETCRHWNHSEVDGEFHCDSCKVILTQTPYWGGMITVGKMTNGFETDGKVLDIRNLIKDQIGTAVEIVNIVFSEKNSWDKQYKVHFMVGRAPMVAEIGSVNQNNKYTPTDRFYVEPVEADATEDAEDMDTVRNKFFFIK